MAEIDSQYADLRKRIDAVLGMMPKRAARGTIEGHIHDLSKHVAYTTGATIAVQDEGVAQGNASTFNFVGTAVSASVAAGVATITVTASGGGHTIQEDGVDLAAQTHLNFRYGLTAADVGGNTVVDIGDALGTGVDVTFTWNEAATRKWQKQNTNASGTIYDELTAGASGSANYAGLLSGDSAYRFVLSTVALGGKLAFGPGSGAADTIIERVAAGVMQFTSTHIRMPASGQIQDSAGAARIKVSSSGNPHILIPGNLRVDGTGGVGWTYGIAVDPSPDAGQGIRINAPTADSTLSYTALNVAGNTTSTVAVGFTGIGCNSNMTLTASVAPGDIIGLDFQAGLATAVNATQTVANLIGCTVRPTIIASGASQNLTATNVYGYRSVPVMTSVASGVVKFTTMAHFAATAISTTASTRTMDTLYGLWLPAQTLTHINTNYYPIFVDGNATTDNKFGSVHRMNFQFGSTTKDFGTGDGVIGVTNATTVPSTDPTAGIVLFSENATAKIRGLMGVNMPLHRSLQTNSASSAITATSETAFSRQFTFPANSVKVGQVIRLKVKGIFSTDAGNDTIQLRVRWGGVAGTLLWDSGAFSILASLTSEYWEVEVDIIVNSVGATGGFDVQGRAFFVNNTTGSSEKMLAQTNSGADITVDTTANKDLVLTATWGNTGNSITGRIWTWELIG